MSLLGFEGDHDLEKLQDKFFTITNLFLYCVSPDGKFLSRMSGDQEDKLALLDRVGRDTLGRLGQEIAESVAEDQIVDDTSVPGVSIIVQAIRNNGKLLALWSVMAVTDPEAAGLRPDFPRVDSEERLYAALLFLRDLSWKYVSYNDLFKGVESENLRSRFTERELTASLRRAGAMAEIVQLLESEEVVEVVLQKILAITGDYLNISSGYVFQVHGDLADVVAEWTTAGRVHHFNQTKNLPRHSILHGDSMIVISDDTKLTAEEKSFFDEMNLKALVIAPIIVNNVPIMYVAIEEVGSRTWTAEEIKFIGNAIRIMQSVVVRRIQKNSLASSYSALEAILDNSGNAIYVKDKESGKVLFANQTLRSIFAEELEKGTLDDLLADATMGEWQTDNQELFHERRHHWYDLYCTTIKWVDGHAANLYALYDITDKKVYQNKIEQQAYTDFLTGLYNRLCCERDLAHYIDEAKKDGQTGALLYLDLDDFKHINDGLGHQYGDILLKAISHGFKRIRGIENTCYRMGGDEFVIIVPPKMGDRCEAVIENVKEIFDKPWFLQDSDYYCTMSMGIVEFPTAGDGVQELIKKADIAMYEAKKAGKNRVVFYSDGIESTSNKRLDMEKNMRDATVDGFKGFEVYYQPIIRVDQGAPTCCGAEALIRWNSSELGFISPAEFIPLAEYLGLINPIGNHVLIEACRECKRWNDAGHGEFKVNVNLSVVQLLQNDIFDIVKSAIAETGIEPKNLTLEVTESLAINDMERMKIILNRIKSLGVRIALDDFGTGYSSLNHLREIPLDVIKIDQSFVVQLDRDNYLKAFIRMVSQLADAIDVNVCVEGIETKEQLEALSGIHISMIQGFYYDRPLSKEEFEQKYIHFDQSEKVEE